MKKQSLIITSMVLLSLGSWAKPVTDDFNQMIQENQKAEAALRLQLQKEAGIQRENNYGKVSKTKLKDTLQNEEIIVSGSNWNYDKADVNEKSLKDANMKRLSNELNTAETQ